MGHFNKSTAVLSFALLGAFGLSACSSGGGGQALSSGIQEPASNNFIYVNNSSDFADYRGNGYSYTVVAKTRNNVPAVYVEDVVGFEGYAGIQPGTFVIENTTGGRATYDADVIIGALIDVNLLTDEGYFVDYDDQISLAVDFDTGRINGQNSSVDGYYVTRNNGPEGSTTARLVVSGTLNGDEFTGTVLFDPTLGDSTQGTLEGLAGDDRVVGAFAGDGSGILFVGGFEGDAN